MPKKLFSRIKCGKSGYSFAALILVASYISWLIGTSNVGSRMNAIVTVDGKLTNGRVYKDRTEQIFLTAVDGDRSDGGYIFSHGKLNEVGWLGYPFEFLGRLYVVQVSEDRFAFPDSRNLDGWNQHLVLQERGFRFETPAGKLINVTIYYDQ